jgi:hypothetical protein
MSDLSAGRSVTDAPCSVVIQLMPSCSTETMTRMISTTLQNKLK